ncbi:MAG: hypothetical protein HOE62_19230 [Alphaproteobacteria bacterium]|jgi:hypothetical protein|nr:hypothetical protein [Alphaproteobacteria bacterium]MBT4020096.1 hypothetical protein [Alphaproteobacteria bacterium]MBT4965227.1 hypothetical protein [Alphaproteobacteria bacterium]MBT5159589.1 hypothetical protein [Alphaproteobacteria bacterium]MBT5919103.1 hypothetical protein [Alphaproteobacteria bacterium]
MSKRPADDGHAHITSAYVERSAAAAISFLTNPENLKLWALTKGEVQILGPALVKGVATGDGSDVYVRIHNPKDSDAVYYHVGGNPDHLAPRIMVQVMAGPHIDTHDKCCVVSMLAWRSADWDDARWQALVDAHEIEIVQIKDLIEGL